MEQHFNIVQLIRKKRDGIKLGSDEINYLIKQYRCDKIPDYQMSAFLMAGFLNGMTEEETAGLTKAMLDSGHRLDLSSLTGPKVDKHSTGGVGDKLSLILAPIVASCGVLVPMISGRGLGHTGGTLDKLESITGFNVNISLKAFKEILTKHGLVMAGQTDDIAPADKRMYALRDVTATVEFIPYIASSIMSKKLAEDIDGLVLDVKYGSGAFMKTQEQARELAETLISIGEAFGTRTIAYVTAMDQPLGMAIGNWLEAKEAFEALDGNGSKDVMQISHMLAGTMIYLGEKAGSIESGISMSREAVSNGRARAKWLDLVKEQGGKPALLLHPEKYPEPVEQHVISASKAGYISKLDAYQLGLAGIELGGGRKTKEDAIDPVSGILLHKKQGERIEKGDNIATLHSNSEAGIKKALEFTDKAIEIADDLKTSNPLIACRIDKQGIHPPD